jgi:hypothetical protein
VLTRLLLAATLLLPVASLAAHHSDTNYELEKDFSITGVVTEFRFVNPHLQITFDVTGSQGVVTKWMAQGTSPNMLVNRGWTNVMLKPGDTITINGHRAKNGSPTMKLVKIFMNGKDLNH